jgi:DNA invertase Pin-like site-specific DNA recombinase
MRYGYVRVSTVEQNEGRQYVTMKEYNVADENVYTDKLSGKDMNRPKLKELLQKVQSGDEIVFSEISRMGRNTKEILNTTDELLQRNVTPIFAKEHITPDNPMSKAMLGMFAVFAQLERDLMLIRQQEGIKLAKEAGKYKGKKPLELDEDNLNIVCRAHIEGKLTVKKASEAIIYKKQGQVYAGVSMPTFYKILDKWCLDNNIEKSGTRYIDKNVEDQL